MASIAEREKSFFAEIDEVGLGSVTVFPACVIGEIVKFRIVSAMTLAVLFMLIRPSPAAADFTVCNSTTAGTVNVAWTVTWLESDGDFNGESHGWWTVAQNECKVIIGPDISAYAIYLYAYAASDPDKLFWGGTHEYCLDPKNTFLYKGDDMNTPCSSGTAYGMRFIDTGNASAYTYTLSDGPQSMARNVFAIKAEVSHLRATSWVFARGVVTSAKPAAGRRGVLRQTPRVSIAVKRVALARKRLGRHELRGFSNWQDGRPETELKFKLYRQATNKIVGISENAAAYLRASF
jgi:uncharacterized membrane protein